MKTGSYIIDLAGPTDDLELRRLLRENPMEGDISLTLEREPSFFLAASIEGSPHQTYVGRECDSGRVVGLASRSIRTMFVNGVPSRVGYLSQARLDHRIRGTRSLLRGAFRFLRQLHDDGEAAFYVTSIIEDNRVARRFFEADWSGKPIYQPWATFSTLALPLLRRRRGPAIDTRPAVAADLDGIAACLQRNHVRLQLAPVWSAADLDSDVTRDLRIDDFLVAVRGSKIVGCLGQWDQSGFKQSVVRGYRGRMARWRPWVNLAARVVGTPRLPGVGEPVASRFLSHIAIDDDDSDILHALVTRAHNEALATNRYAFVTLGFASEHPFVPSLRRSFRSIEYRSVLYLVYWEDGRTAAAALDNRLPHLEAAVL